MRIDGSQRRTLLSGGIKLPRGLIVHPQSGYMWWSDWGKKTIERAAMDGSRQEVIVNTHLAWVNGITADFSGCKF